MVNASAWQWLLAHIVKLERVPREGELRYGENGDVEIHL